MNPVLERDARRWLLDCAPAVVPDHVREYLALHAQNHDRLVRCLLAISGHPLAATSTLTVEGVRLLLDAAGAHLIDAASVFRSLPATLRSVNLPSS